MKNILEGWVGTRIAVRIGTRSIPINKKGARAEEDLFLKRGKEG